MEDSREFSKYFHDRILEVKNLNYKGNNRIFSVATTNGTYLVKKYSRIHMDNFDRGRTEFNSLSYLWNKGFRDIPEPKSFDDANSIGIYAYKDGIRLSYKEITSCDIEKAVDFLVRLHSLSNEDKKNFAPASSACLNLMEYVNVIDKRLSRIINYEPRDEEETAKKFLDEEVVPRIRILKEDFFRKSDKFDLKKELPLEEQVLTPADFGFHNILVDSERNYTFLDFEYFGRDDPVRQILDFLHHDKSRGIKAELKQKFVDEYIRMRNSPESFKTRLKLINPLIGITWVLIYLNVLSGQQLEHVKFAHGDIGNVIGERVEKAKAKLSEI